MPQAIRVTDAEGRWATYVPLTLGGKIVVARPSSEADENSPAGLCLIKQLYRSPNGDIWSLARNPATGSAFVRHQANTPSGGQVTDIELGAFLSGPRNPEHEALLRLIGGSILDPQGVEMEDELPVVKPRREWSDAELKKLGDMLVGDLSIEEIARLLRRDKVEVHDKVVEVGRACLGAPPTRWEPLRQRSEAFSANPSRTYSKNLRAGCVGDGRTDVGRDAVYGT